MTIKQILKINFILLILIIISIVGILLFNNYLYSPYDALNDLRETERDDALDVDEIPSIILTNGNKFAEEYRQALEEKNIENLKIVRAYTVFSNKTNQYPSIYIVVDTKKNKVVADINLRYTKNGKLSSLAVTYREFNDKDFLLYNDCLINLKSLNIPLETIEKINKTSKEKPKDNFNIGNTYKYMYSYREPTEQFYTRIVESRNVYITL